MWLKEMIRRQWADMGPREWGGLTKVACACGGMGKLLGSRAGKRGGIARWKRMEVEGERVC